ncbi:MAG: hypothetical protein WEA56_16220 [Balneolaceae bacterium]
MNKFPDIIPNRLHKTARSILVFALCLSVFAPVIQAHEGPPFPIIVDAEVGPYLVSVWTDPDIGIGTFFVVFEPVSDDHSPEINSVQVAVQPTSGRLDEVLYAAESQRVRNGARYYAEVEFDQGEMWQVRVTIEGEDWEGELNSEVEATPDGTIGPIGLLVYALPFVGIGILWFRAIVIRRREE